MKRSATAPLADEDVRAIMAARIAGMARGGAGVHPGALETLVAMLNAGVHPVVPSVGSVGASDLMHMAAIAMVVMGRGQARLEGGAMPGGEALERAAIAPHRLRPKDGLALISGNGASIGLGALAALAAERTAVLAEVDGALRDQVAAARAAVEVELKAVDDSPLVSIDQDRLMSTGNFHPMALALAFESLRVALAHLGMLSERRMNKLVTVLYGEASFEFGVQERGRYSVPGFVIYSAAALLSELKQLATPVTLDCPPLDLDVEDHATLAPQAVMLARRALFVLETILAIEVLVAISALDDRPQPTRLGRGTQPVYEAVHATLEPLEADASAATVVETVRRRLLEIAS